MPPARTCHPTGAYKLRKTIILRSEPVRIPGPEESGTGNGSSRRRAYSAFNRLRKPAVVVVIVPFGAAANAHRSGPASTQFERNPVSVWMGISVYLFTMYAQQEAYLVCICHSVSTPLEDVVEIGFCIRYAIENHPVDKLRVHSSKCRSEYSPIRIPIYSLVR